MPPDALKRLAPWAAGLGLWLAYLAVYLPYLPGPGGLWAADYYLHFPNLLTGVYWRLHNRLGAAPWFNPAQCGGIPYFADPNVAYYSLPQFLGFVVAPDTAIRATFAIFAALGCLGAYGMMRSSFAASRAASAAAAGLFLFNTFFAARMLIGHLTFHAFMLAPFIAWAALPPPGAPPPKAAAFAARAGLAALALAYMFQSGMVHGLPPVGLSLIALAVMRHVKGGGFGRAMAILAAGGLGALALSASKLAAEVAWLGQFPRGLYTLPGVQDPLFAALIGPLTLIGVAPENSNWIVNSQWLLDRHEWEYGISVAPALLLALALGLALWRAKRPKFDAAKLAWLGALALVLAVPAALNFYQPAWNAFLKSLPYFGQSSSLLRFLSAYILVGIAAAGLLIDRIAPESAAPWRSRTALAAAALAVMLAQTFATPRAYYAKESYDPRAILAAAADARADGRLPAVSRIAQSGGAAEGVSTLNCYQPLFGYRLEAFPRGALHEGPVAQAGALNLKNPACYVFPAANACAPGDAFSAAEASSAQAFLDYRPFPFARPAAQVIADAVNWAALWVFAAGAIGLSAASIWRRAPR